MTIEKFHHYLNQRQNADPLRRALEGFRSLEPRRALGVLTEELNGGWWEWKPTNPEGV